MTRDEILALTAGRSLNVHIAEEVMGNRVVQDAILGDTEIYTLENGEPVYGRLTPYSEDLSSAQVVILRMTNLGYTEAGLWENEKRPDVICRAALLTLFDKNTQKKGAKKRPNLRVVR